MGTAFAVPEDYAGPSSPFSKGRGSARQIPTRNNPARLISDIFVPTGDIGGRGRGQGPVGEGEGGRKRRRGGARQRGMERGERE